MLLPAIQFAEFYEVVKITGYCKYTLHFFELTINFFRSSIYDSTKQSNPKTPIWKKPALRPGIIHLV